MSRPWWKSKTVWVIGGAIESVGSYIAYDRWRAKQIREALLQEARAYGETPVTLDEQPRRVTILAIASDRKALRDQKLLWKTYGAELLTVAGIDYQWMELDCATIDKEVHEKRPVADGEAANETVPKVCEERALAGRVLSKWIGNVKPFADDHLEQIVLDKVKMPENKRWYKEGVAATTKPIFEEFKTNRCEKLYYLPLDPAPSWIDGLISYFQHRTMAQEIGEAVMQIVRS